LATLLLKGGVVWWLSHHTTLPKSLARWVVKRIEREMLA